MEQVNLRLSRMYLELSVSTIYDFSYKYLLARRKCLKSKKNRQIREGRDGVKGR